MQAGNASIAVFSDCKEIAWIWPVRHKGVRWRSSPESHRPWSKSLPFIRPSVFTLRWSMTQLNMNIRGINYILCGYPQVPRIFTRGNIINPAMNSPWLKQQQSKYKYTQQRTSFPNDLGIYMLQESTHNIWIARSDYNILYSRHALDGPGPASSSALLAVVARGVLWSCTHKP